MKDQKMLDIVRGQLKAFNNRDWDRFREVLAPDAVYDEVGSGRKLTGRDEILGLIRGWTEAFPDVKGSIQTTLVSDDRVVCEIAYEGTHDGELAAPTGSIGPTGNRIHTRNVQIFRIADGHIVETRHYFDMLQMLQALEALPTPAAHGVGA